MAEDDQPENEPSGEKTFTQEQLDRILNERISRLKGKYSDYEQLKAGAENAAKLQEQLDATSKENAQLKAQAEQAEHERELDRARSTVAAKYGIPDPSILAGDDENTIDEYAKRVIKAFESMRQRGTVADGSSQEAKPNRKRRASEDFARAMSEAGF